jgi:Bacterial membrane protein YfhO
VLARYRLITRASFHPTAGSALGAAREQLYALDRGEHFVRPGGPAETLAYPGRPRLRAVEDRGGEIAVRYLSATPAFFTAAVTYDRGWRAAVDGAPVPVYTNAIGQLGVAVPAGEHRLRLAYRDPRVLPGAAVSLGTLLAVLALLRRARAPMRARISPPCSSTPSSASTPPSSG